MAQCSACEATVSIARRKVIDTLLKAGFNVENRNFLDFEVRDAVKNLGRILYIRVQVTPDSAHHGWQRGGPVANEDQ